MLDIKSRLILKFLVKECNNGTYKIIEGSDIISAMPNKYRVDSDGLEHILTYLERQDCISIKYDDDGVYCLCVLPYGYEINEGESKKNKDKKPKLWLFVVLCSIFSIIGGFLGVIIAKLVGL